MNSLGVTARNAEKFSVTNQFLTATEVTLNGRIMHELRKKRKKLVDHMVMGDNDEKVRMRPMNFWPVNCHLRLSKILPPPESPIYCYNSANTFGDLSPRKTFK